MEASLRVRQFPCYHKVYQNTFQKEELQDCIVPDTMPDMESVVSSAGTVFIRSKDLSAGRLRLEANVSAQLALRPESGGELFGLNANIPVYLSIEDERIREDSVCYADLRLIRLEVRLLNPRKLTLNAVVEILPEIYVLTERCFHGAPEDQELHIHSLEKEIRFTTVSVVKEKTFVQTDEITLSAEKPAGEEIVGSQTTVLITDTKFSGKKVILQGNFCSVVLYRTDGMNFAAAEFVTPFSQILDVDTEAEGASIAANILLSGIYYDFYDERTIRMELHAVAQMKLYTDQQTSILTDAYSNYYPLELRREKIELQQIKKEMILHESMKTTLEIPAMSTDALSVSMEPLETICSGGEVLLHLKLWICMKTESGETVCLTRTAEHKFTVELSQGEALRLCSTNLENVTAALVNGGTELRLSLEIRAFLLEEEQIETVSSIAYDENNLLDLSEKPSLVILRCSSVDPLWQLAKENYSCVQEIVQVNHLSEESGAWEKMLIIPRTT